MRTVATCCPGFGSRNTATRTPSRKGAREALRFELKPDDDLQGDERPNIANRPFTVTVQLAAAGRDGVLVAQGGRLHGFSLYFKEGDLHWAIRREGDLQVIAARATELTNARKLTASRGKDGTPRLNVDGREVASGKADGLIPNLPADGLQVGRDLKGAVGDYRGPFPFKGEIQKVELVLEE